jgi:hypothetical protein
MADPEIYISITRGSETLTLDGNLHLFGELLTTLSDAARDLDRPCPKLVSTAHDVNPEKKGSYVTD